ncbi:phosphoribosylaminoimidazolecarboxamide formyltransferase [Christensenellaceae bacterium OttesenSCG-928-L17]|nr:phosphoribosylaminoimidazolecarboxamide formyltransferase [Christensenellaceae bacterium OttesenSCG-928-L17]
MDYTLKYGCNPNQSPARIEVEGKLPLRVLNGAPGYINLLDALNGWQLVRELAAATGLPAAASYKHTSPAGAAIGLPLSVVHRRMFFVKQDNPSPLCCAYARARGADRLSSFGDFIALSDVCDTSTAALIAREVSDGIIAPGYEEEALALLKKKRGGKFTILQMDPSFTPKEMETRELFGISFVQKRNDASIDTSLLTHVVTANKNLPDFAKQDLLIALITLKYTQSNSVCYAKDGQTIGVGAGQQSRIHCTRLAGNKADLFHLRQHPRVLELPFRPETGRPARDNAIDLFLSEEECPALLENWENIFEKQPIPLTPAEKKAWLLACNGVSLASDAFFPFEDNVLRAKRSGVQFIAQPGGSIRDAEVIAACDRAEVWMAFTGLRLFYH